MDEPKTCRSCGAEIVFIRSKKGRLIPCDPARVAIVTELGEVVFGRISHFATCPDAKKWSGHK